MRGPAPQAPHGFEQCIQRCSKMCKRSSGSGGRAAWYLVYLDVSLYTLDIFGHIWDVLLVHVYTRKLLFYSKYQLYIALLPFIALIYFWFITCSSLISEWLYTNKFRVLCMKNVWNSYALYSGVGVYLCRRAGPNRQCQKGINKEIFRHSNHTLLN